MIDIDHFKEVNDTYGHKMGDEVLKRISEQIRNQLRRDDMLGRIGGEEFLIMLQNTPLEDAVHKAETIRQDIENMIWSNKDFHVTISGGVHAYVKDEQLDDFIDNADKMLYKAKRTGRNKICWE